MAANDDSNQLIAPIFLVIAAVNGFIAANFQLQDLYFNFLSTKLNFEIGGYSLINKSVLLLVNDGLMAVFFLFVGLELKREVIVGELSSIKNALLPLLAAVGGMLVPAVLYFIVNPNAPEANGWGIPMATDIAFALGLLAVLGSRAPVALKVLLTAIAIVDDLGAILVIAIFYTSKVDITSLFIAFGFFASCLALNISGVKKLSLYMLLGIPLWYFMLKSGVHATIAGVLLAMTIPLATKGTHVARLIEDITQKKRSEVDSPAVFLEKSLLPWVGFLVVPVFAFCNAGVRLEQISLGTISIGIILGLTLGKPIGIVGAAWLAEKLNLAKLPKGVTWREITGLGFLAGIGFTMSLFISSLAFDQAQFNNEAKLAILLASFIAGGMGVLCFISPKKS